MFRLAHVTDPHFRGWSGVGPLELLGKRAVGAANLLLNRTRKHKMALLEALRDDLAGHPVDHVAVTGDLSNISLRAELEAARRWLDGYSADATRVTVIPGNHDAYVAEVVRERWFETTFAPYQTDDRGAGRPAEEHYPFLRLRGPLALLGASSAVATGDLGAWGELGAAQLGRLEALLGRPEVKERVRVVLVHHPPVMQKGGANRNLRDRHAFEQMLARVGADLVLHGHDHRDERAALHGPAGALIPVVGAGSASYAGGPGRRARYNVYEIDGRGIVMHTRAHDEGTDAFHEVARERLAGP